MTMILYSRSPLDQFEIRDLLNIDVPILGYLHLSITNIGLYLIATFLAFQLNILASNYSKVVSNNGSIGQDTSILAYIKFILYFISLIILSYIILNISLIIISYIFYKSGIIVNIFNSPFSFVLSFFFTSSFVLLYLDDFKLSNVKFIKYIQIFSFICIPIFIIYNLPFTFTSDIILCIKDSDINLHGHVSIDKEAGKAIGQGMSQGLSTIGNQWGLGATMVGIGGAVSKAIAKSGMPPAQKVGAIVVSGLIAGLGHSSISSINRRSIYEDSANIPVSNTNIGSGINKLVDDSHISPLQELLFNGEMMNYLCLSLMYLLVIQLVFKLYFKDYITLNSLKLLGNNTKNKIQYYFNKIIKLNKQMSIIWIWFILIILIFGLSIDIYVLEDILANLDSYVNIHSKFKPNIVNNIYIIDMPIQSIRDQLLNLKAINYISIIIIISLILQVMLKFHFNKNIKNIYILLTLFILIVALGFSAHIYGDLYVNVDNYVFMYINLISK